jgi:hypothetical protein
MPASVLGFIRGGFVIAACDSRYEVFDTKNGNLNRVATGAHAGRT